MIQVFQIRQSQAAGYSKNLLGQDHINPHEQNHLNKRRRSGGSSDQFI